MVRSAALCRLIKMLYTPLLIFLKQKAATRWL
jgi:hypothetical protein